MQIDLVRTEEIKEYNKNTKEHPKEQITKIANSIKEFGFNVPLILNKDNVIIAGHGRLYAAKELKLKEVPVIYKKDLTQNQINAYRIADNKTAESDWNNEFLIEELKRLDSSNYDLSLTGFDEDELRELLNNKLDLDGIKDVEPDNVDDIKTHIKKGDMFKLGRHRLMCGDSTNKEEIELLMDGNKADMVFTDPPYNVNYSGGRQQLSNKKLNDGKILNDDMTEEEFNLFLKETYSMIDYATSENASIYICHGDSKIKPLLVFLNTWNNIGWHHANEIIWQKNVASLGYCDYRYIHECMSYGWKGKQHYNARDMTEVDVWFEKRDHGANYQHPTQKPVEVCARAINNSSKDTDLVLDIFGGSGSTLIATEQLDRTCYMMELDNKYCQVIINRWEKLTNKKAEKVNG